MTDNYRNALPASAIRVDSDPETDLQEVIDELRASVADAAGGGGTGTSGAAVFLAQVECGGYTPSTSGAAMTAVISGTTDAPTRVSATTLAQTSDSGDDTGIYCNVRAPVFSAGTMTVDVELSVTNPDATEKLTLKQTLPLTSGQYVQPVDFTDAAQIEHVGSDLSLGADGATINSATGGQLVGSAYVTFTVTDNLVA